MSSMYIDTVFGLLKIMRQVVNSHQWGFAANFGASDASAFETMVDPKDVERGWEEVVKDDDLLNCLGSAMGSGTKLEYKLYN